MQKSKISKKKAAGGFCGVLATLFFIALVASIFNGHGGASTTPPTPIATTAPLVVVASSPTQAVPAKPTVKATTAPKTTLTPKPQPTHQATPKPTPKPTQPPACQAVNNNPWCYNFSPGNYITNPPGNFCSYFNCIASFVSADDPDGGYIVECSDATISQSGGESGSCSHHGGNMRPLYSH